MVSFVCKRAKPNNRLLEVILDKKTTATASRKVLFMEIQKNYGNIHLREIHFKPFLTNILVLNPQTSPVFGWYKMGILLRDGLKKVFGLFLVFHYLKKSPKTVKIGDMQRHIFKPVEHL